MAILKDCDLQGLLSKATEIFGKILSNPPYNTQHENTQTTGTPNRQRPDR